VSTGVAAQSTDNKDSSPLPAASDTPQASLKTPAPSPGAPEDEPPKKKQVNTSRCWTCNTKIGLTGFQCKCEYYFCAKHRYSDMHVCTFDYKAQGKQLLTKANPTVVPAKISGM